MKRDRLILLVLNLLDTDFKLNESHGVLWEEQATDTSDDIQQKQLMWSGHVISMNENKYNVTMDNIQVEEKGHLKGNC